MPVDLRRVYLDANVLLAYVGDEAGRAGVVAALLDAARTKKIEVLTSVLTITEVAYAAHEIAHGLTTDGEAEIDKLWEPASPILVVEMSPVHARRARSLIRAAKDRGIAAPGANDALHIASAVLHDCTQIFTYEGQGRRQQWAELSGLDVVEPYVNEPPLDM